MDQIPLVSKILVSGYLREIETLLDNSWMIADDVRGICLLFARIEMDRVDKNYIHRDIYIKEGNVIIHNGNASKPRNIYFENIVWTGIHIWQFECLCIASWYPRYNALIGIFNAQFEPVTTDKTFDNTIKDTVTGYGLSTNGALSNTKDDQWLGLGRCNHRVCNVIVETDIIRLRLDFNELKLMYFVNGRKVRKDHDINPGKYRAAISMLFPNCAFELISYTMIL